MAERINAVKTSFFGKGAIRLLGPELQKMGIRRALLVTDRFLYDSGAAARVGQVLSDAGVEYAVYYNVQPNPTVQVVNDCIAAARTLQVQLLVALGGGSAIDTAKAASIVVACGGTVEQYEGENKSSKPGLPIVAVNTTAGTGSETTLAAVITDDKSRHKNPINDFFLIPDYAVLDPKVTLSLPPFITATTGMDALTHAVEAYIGNSTTHGTRENALQAVKLIFENLDTAVEKGFDINARRNMLRASYYAGCAFTKSYVGYVHAVAHSLGGAYNVPHGLANAVLLPFVLEAYGPVVYPKLHALAIAAGLADKNTPDEEAAKTFIAAIQAMKKRYGIGDHIPEICEEDIPKLARYADKEGNPLYPVPVLMDSKELEQFYYLLMEKEA